MAMNFREAQPADLDALIVQMRHLYEHDGAPFDEQTSRNAALQLLREPQAGCIQVVEVGGAMAGYFVLTFGFGLEYGGRYGLLDELFINDQHRGAGLGTEAVHRAQTLCADRGVTTLLLEVDHANEKAARLYERLGFQENSRKLMRCRVESIG
jgi:ribosomal protein S18 acetylase RimI-like enzyme